MKTKDKIIVLLSMLFKRGSNGNNWKTFEEYSQELKDSGEFEGTARVEMIDKYAYVDYDFDSEILEQIRKKYDTVVIAGTGNALEKTLNMLAWVSDKITHNGSVMVDFKVINGLTLLEHSYDKKKHGINCRLVAMLLNDCLKSVGIKSKMCSLMPKNGNTGDNHVGNMVYIDHLEKWILVDASWNSYFKNEDGKYLDVFELRDAFANNYKVIVNKKAHHNHCKYNSKQDDYYKKYMSKNLYYFKSCNNGKEIITIAPNDLNINGWWREYYKSSLDNGLSTQEQYDAHIEDVNKNVNLNYSYSKEDFLKVN